MAGRVQFPNVSLQCAEFRAGVLGFQSESVLRIEESQGAVFVFHEEIRIEIPRFPRVFVNDREIPFRPVAISEPALDRYGRVFQVVRHERALAIGIVGNPARLERVPLEVSNFGGFRKFHGWRHCPDAPLDIRLGGDFRRPQRYVSFLGLFKYSGEEFLPGKNDGLKFGTGRSLGKEFFLQCGIQRFFHNRIRTCHVSKLRSHRTPYEVIESELRPLVLGERFHAEGRFYRPLRPFVHVEGYPSVRK